MDGNGSVPAASGAATAHDGERPPPGPAPTRPKPAAARGVKGATRRGRPARTAAAAGGSHPAVECEADDNGDDLASEPVGSLYRTMAGAFVLHPKFQAVLDEICNTIDDCHGVEDEPPCLHVAGPSGAGKSTIAAKLKARYPVVCDGRRVRQVPLPDKVCDHVPILILRMPTQPTVISVGQAILRAYGDPKWSAGSRASVERRVHEYVRQCGTRALVLDDAQRAVDRNGTVVKIDLVDWLKEMHQFNGIILILVSLSRLGHLFEEDGDQIERRYDAPLELPPYCWIDQTGADCVSEQDQFLAIVSRMTALSPLPFALEVNVDNEDQMVAELALKRYFYASQGLIGMLVKLLKTAMRIAQRDPDSHPTVTLRLLHEACGKAFRLKKKMMLNAFAEDWMWQLPPPVLDDTLFVRQTKKRVGKRKAERDLMDGLTK